MAEETGKLRVRLVTPEKVLFEAETASVELPSASGYLEVLYGHAPLLAKLGAGDVTLHGGPEGDVRYHVNWGFAEVLPDRVTILASDALNPADIDTNRAQQQLERGLELWKQAGEEEAAYNKALHVIAEAEAKIASAATK